jgi:hypothetical protein
LFGAVRELGDTLTVESLDMFIIEQLRNAGFLSIRKQSWKDFDGNLQTNIYVIVRALRGDHTEAIMIGAPKSTHDGINAYIRLNFVLYF